MLGLTTYAETLSVYGTERVFVDGDDTPWSKAFLGSAYASRGVKVRFTRGTGSEALMGHAEGCSMLYLEARCLAVTRGAGSQGVQNGSISCIALPLSCPAACGRCWRRTCSPRCSAWRWRAATTRWPRTRAIRKTAKLMRQFIPGTDFIFSGYSAMPRSDNMFGGGNFDADDFDEWLTLQRDMQVDGGIEPAQRGPRRSPRTRGALAIQAVFDELGFPPVADEEVAAAVTAYASGDLPDRDRAADVEAADRVLEEGVSGLDVACILARRGFRDVADGIFRMRRQRVSADYLQTAAMIGPDGRVARAVNDPNQYLGPGTGYRLEGARWEHLRALPHQIEARSIGVGRPRRDGQLLRVVGPAQRGTDGVEVVVALGPAYGAELLAPPSAASRTATCWRRCWPASPRAAPCRGWCTSATSDCAAIGQPAPTWPAPAWPSACSRAERPSSTARPAAARQPGAVPHGAQPDASSSYLRSAATPPATRSGPGRPRAESWTTSRGRS